MSTKKERQAAAAKEQVVQSTKGIDAELNKKFGDVIQSVADMRGKAGRIIPTTLSLDIVLNGGIEEGTFTTLVSKPKTGKTTLLLEVCKNAQKMGITCYYLDIEGRLNYREDGKSKTLLQCIKDLSLTEEDEKNGLGPYLRVVQSVEGNILTAEQFLQIALDLLQSTKGILVVLDSIALLNPESSIDSQMNENAKMTETQKLMYTFLRKALPIIQTQKNTLIAITHLQSNPGGYGSPVKEYGGVAHQYSSSNIISSYETAKEKEGKDGGKPVGHDITFKVKSSSLGGPGGKAIIPIYYGRGVDIYEDVANQAIDYGIISRKGAWYAFTDSVGGSQNMQGIDSVKDFLEKNPSEYKFMRDQILEMFSGTTK